MMLASPATLQRSKSTRCFARSCEVFQEIASAVGVWDLEGPTFMTLLAFLASEAIEG